MTNLQCCHNRIVNDATLMLLPCVSHSQAVLWGACESQAALKSACHLESPDTLLTAFREIVCQALQEKVFGLLLGSHCKDFLDSYISSDTNNRYWLH